MLAKINLVVSAILLCFHVHSLPLDEDCSDKVVCHALQKLFINIALGGEYIQTKNEMGWAIVSIADNNSDSSVDFNEFKSKALEILEDIFNFFDRDGNGLMDQEEATIDMISQRPLKYMIQKVFMVLDQNQDGFISTEDIPNNKLFDKDNDGKVTVNELLTAISNDQITDTIYLPRPIQNLYNILDSNKDEKTSLKEVKNFESVVMKVFNVMDKDGNCFVTLKEILEVLDENDVRKDYQVALDIIASQYIKIFQFLATDFMLHADSNNDGNLEFDEVINFSDMKFVEDSMRAAVSLGHPNLSALYYIMGAPGGPDRFGRPNWGNGDAAQKSLATWLSLADGLLRHESFHKENKCY